MTKKQLKDLKAARDIFKRAEKSITDGLGVLTEYCDGISAGFSNTPDTPDIIRLALFPLKNDLDTLFGRLRRLTSATLDLIAREETP